jgi:transcription elongation factor Elf1
MDTYEILNSKDPNVIAIEVELQKYKFKADIEQIIHSIHCQRCDCSLFTIINGHPLHVLICNDCGLKFQVYVKYEMLEE